jgi:hypothetical protein
MNEDLQDLLRAPHEDLHIELKRWMDPLDRVVQAKFAKELLALRNSGGGFLVIGFRDEHPAVPDPERPASLDSFNTDVINNLIKKYAEPPFHCVSHLVAHPITGELYPVIAVPAGARVPVRCKADSPDGGRSIKIDTYYIRRPGPESNAPQSGAEWDALLERCLLNRKDELVTTLSNLLGVSRVGELMSVPSAAHPFAELRTFRDATIARLEELQGRLPPDDPARFQHGRYILSARILGELQQLSLRELVDALSSLKRYTGWSPLNIFSRSELAPYAVEDDLIECWLGQSERRDVGHADFWRASTQGFITLARGFQEDGEMSHGSGSPGVGKGIELTLPPWRIAEYLLRIRELGNVMAPNGFRIQLIVEWEGLADRRLFSHGHRRHLSDYHIAHSDYRGEAEISSEEVDAALSQIIAGLTLPLYRRFSFFEPPAELFEQELGRLQNREFG